MTNKSQRPPRPYTDVPAPYGHCSNEKCQRALYIPPVASGECCVCDFDRAVAEGDYEAQGHKALLAALAPTPTDGSDTRHIKARITHQGKGEPRMTSDTLWMADDTEDITPITGSPEGDALMYGEDDSPEELGEMFDDVTAAGWDE